MRFNAIIISALAVASLGVKAAPAADTNLEARTGNEPCTPVVVVETKTLSACPAPPTPKPPTCKYYCIFEHWDCDIGNVDGISSKQKIEDCASDCCGNSKCKSTVFNSNHCYPKDPSKALSWNYNYNWGSKLAIEGKCKDLKDECDREPVLNKKKYNPKMFDGCWEKQVCI